MEQEILDTIQRRATPEGCALDLRPAGPMSRALAWFIDSVVRVVVFASSLQVFVMLGQVGLGLAMLTFFLLEWIAPVLFERFWSGQTPGKRALGLVVLHDDGTPVGWQASLARNAMRFVDFLPLMYATGFVTTLMNADGKRLGDLVAGTMVVHLPSPRRSIVEPVIGAEPPRVALLPDERRAVLDYARRASTLTDERSLELATVASPLVDGDAPAMARARLLRVANFLAGER